MTKILGISPLQEKVTKIVDNNTNPLTRYGNVDTRTLRIFETSNRKISDLNTVFNHFEENDLLYVTKAAGCLYLGSKFYLKKYHDKGRTKPFNEIEHILY